MIKNSEIIKKLKEKTKDDKIMYDFLFDIINHEMENYQYSKKYEKLIDEAIEKREKNEI